MQRLRWIGHIERMVEPRTPKMIMASTIGGKRRRGRPMRQGGGQKLKKDINMLRIIRWKK